MAYTGQGKINWVSIFTWLAVIALLAWFFIFRRADSVTLKDGSVIFRQGFTNLYYMVTDGKKVKINYEEYQYLIAKESGDCIKPPSTNAQRIIDPTAKSAGEVCNYYGYQGVVNECGTCSLAQPARAACSPDGGSAQCVTGGSPLGQIEPNGYFDQANLCRPCSEKPLY